MNMISKSFDPKLVEWRNVKDPENVYVSNKPPKSLGSNYTKVPWKYRWFWDGGLHCITLDINREGKQEDYFAS